jgi:hypothetical protein
MAELTNSPYDSNTSVNTHVHILCTPINSGLLQMAFTCTLGAATGLGTGSKNYRDAVITIYDDEDEVIVTSTLRLKTSSQGWYASHTYGPFYTNISFDPRNGGNIFITVTIDGGVGTITSCRWTESGNHPNKEAFAWPTYNVAPVWENTPSYAYIANSNLVTGKIPENETTLNVSWQSGYDADGDTLYYNVWRETSTGLSTKIATNTTGLSLVDTIGAGNAGVGYRYKVTVNDAIDTCPIAVYSSWVYKNTFVGGVLSGTPAMVYATTTLPLTRTSNANTYAGAITNTYVLTSSDVTIYNNTGLGTNCTITIWRSGGYPAGMYIKFSDIEAKYTSLTGILHFALTVSNGMGSSRVTTINATVDLRSTPDAPVFDTPPYTGSIMILGYPHFLPDIQRVTIGWGDCAGAISYEVWYRQHHELPVPWILAVKDLGPSSYTMYFPTDPVTPLFYDVKVIARTSYLVYSETICSDVLQVERYLAPTLTVNSMVRVSDAAIIDITALLRASQYLSDDNGILTFTFTDILGNPIDISSGGLDQTFNSTDAGGQELNADDSYQMTLFFQDIIGAELGISTTIHIQIPKYVPIFSIRKKGIGINCIPDGTSLLMVSSIPMTPISGTASPTVIPSFLGQIFIDTNNDDAYIAVGLTNSDWKKIN